jgi:hypothetical protein
MRIPVLGLGWQDCKGKSPWPPLLGRVHHGGRSVACTSIITVRKYLFGMALGVMPTLGKTGGSEQAFGESLLSQLSLTKQRQNLIDEYGWVVSIRISITLSTTY